MYSAKPPGYNFKNFANFGIGVLSRFLVSFTDRLAYSGNK